LREGQLGQLFRRVIDNLERLLDEGKWQEAHALIEELQQQSMERSDYRLRTLLDDPSLDGRGAWVAGWFVPAVRALRAHRRELRQPLRAESIYHLALAELLSFERSHLLRARARARALRRTRLPGTETSGPAQDLRLLTICLEVNCVARLLEPTDGINPTTSDDTADEDWHPVTAAWNVTREWPPMLRRAMQDPARSREVRAAAHTALGLAARLERREQDTEDGRRFYDVRPNRLPQEVDHYREALNLHETATTHCYLAECLIEIGSPQEARAHVTRALALSPLHPLARRLLAPMLDSPRA
jgi:hypothetical protein